MSFRLILIVVPLLAACAQFPEVDAVVTEEAKTAPPPQLVPLSEILSQTTAENPEKGAETDEELRRRQAALQARANRLRQQ